MTTCVMRCGSYMHHLPRSGRWPLKVLCGIWHQDVSSRSCKSFIMFFKLFLSSVYSMCVCVYGWIRFPNRTSLECHTASSTLPYSHNAPWSHVFTQASDAHSLSSQTWRRRKCGSSDQTTFFHHPVLMSVVGTFRGGQMSAWAL